MWSLAPMSPRVTTIHRSNHHCRGVLRPLGASVQSNRLKVWENLLVAGVNALIEQGKITLDPLPDNGRPAPGVEARFTHQDGTLCVAHARDVGSSELEITVAYDPTPGV